MPISTQYLEPTISVCFYGTKFGEEDVFLFSLRCSR